MKKGKKLLPLIGWLAAIGVILAVLLVVGANAAVVCSTREKIISPQEAAGQDADCILVLGAGVRPDHTPTRMLADRIETGVNLYHAGASDRLLMSGDHGRKDYDEVNVMKDEAIKAGVPSQAVFMDHAGFSTYDSIARAAEIFQAQRIVIVTQKYHLYRALYLADAFGLDAVGVDCSAETYSGQFSRDVREIAARTKDFALAVLKPEPSFGGKAIPISGNGDVTNDRA